jgi:hypothetical protein
VWVATNYNPIKEVPLLRGSHFPQKARLNSLQRCRDFVIDLAGRKAPRKAPVPQRIEMNSASPIPPATNPKIAPPTMTAMVKEMMTMRSRRVRSAIPSP